MRIPMPLLEQIDALRAFKRTLRADFDRAYRQDAESYRKRRVSPFVESLRYARFRNAAELLDVAEECMRELRQARATSIAEFFPGDQVTMEVVVKGWERGPARFVIIEVEWAKPDSYHYVARQVTKSGELFKRNPTWLTPSKRVIIKRCNLPLSEEAARTCEHLRNGARAFVDDVRDRGKIEDIVTRVRESRARRGY